MVGASQGRQETLSADRTVQEGTPAQREHTRWPGPALLLCLFPFFNLYTPDYGLGSSHSQLATENPQQWSVHTCAYQTPAPRKGGALIRPQPMTQQESRSL